MMRRTGRAAAVLAAAAAVLVFAPSAPASAHAGVLSTLPADLQELDASPQRLEVAFDETVSMPDDGLRLVDESGASRQLEFRLEPTVSGSVAVVEPPQLADGWYALTWRAISADGHPIDGSITFQVGDSLLAAGEVDFDIQDPARPFLAASHPLRGLGYLLTALAVGLLGAMWAVSGAEARKDAPELAERLRRYSISAAVGGIASVALHTLNSSIILNGGSFSQLGTVVQLVLRSSSGSGTLIRLSGLFVMCTAVLLLAEQATRKAGWAAAAVGSGALYYSYALAGHARIVPAALISSTALVVHLAAGVAWLGGIPGVLLAVSRRQQLSAGAVAEIMGRFSKVATVSVIAVLVAGTVTAFTMLESPVDLVTTTYGLSLFAKIAVVSLIAGVGAYNHYVVVPGLKAEAAGEAATETAEVAAGKAEALPGPAGTGNAGSKLKASLRVETAGLLAVVAATAVLTSSGAPAAGWSDGLAHLGHQHGATDSGFNPRLEDVLGDVEPRISYAAVGSGEAKMTTTPARAGRRNVISIEVFDISGETAAVESVDLTLGSEAGEVVGLERSMQPWDEGEFRLETRDLFVAGEWQVEAYIRFENGNVEIVQFTLEVQEDRDA